MVCVLCTLFPHTEVRAQMQVYPVSVTTRLIPPYSVNISDYAAPGCEQLKVIILQRDLTQAPYLLYLKMQIELNGKVIIRTSPEYVPPTLTIEPGIPTVISGTDLAVFFDPSNMEFSGYSREAYLRSKVLPEGSYVISFTAYDFTRRDVALSQGGSMFCYLAKTDPPVLNLPFNNAVVRGLNPQNINFQWLSGSTSSPNFAFSTGYRFELFEMRTGGINPADIVQNTRPIYVCETDLKNINYSIEDPILEKGMRYVWRVKAFDRNGSDYIRNAGYSEVFSFLYDDAETSDATITFNTVKNFTAEAVSPRKAKLSWDASEEYRSYKIFYREKDKQSKWYESETDNNNAEIKGLTPGLIYECRVQGKRGNAWGSFSEIDTALMPFPAVIECGSPFEPMNVNNRQPLIELMKMQQFDAGGFMVTLIDQYATSFSPGRFSGKGFVQVPIFGHKKILCEFTDVFINTDYQMVEGTVRLIKDAKNNLLMDLDDVFEGGSENGKVIEGTEQVGIILPDITLIHPEQIVLNTVGNELLIVQSGDTVHVDISDQAKENSGIVTLKDAGGNIYSVNTQTGKVTEMGKSLPPGNSMAALPTIIDNKIGTVEFREAKGARFAFDKWNDLYNNSNIFKKEYATIKMSDGKIYNVPIKLIPVGETDIVLAVIDIKDKSIKADSVVFVSGSGTMYKAVQEKNNGDEYIITLPSGKENDGLEIFAYAEDKMHSRILLGKLIVVSYSVEHPKLVLVPVNDNSTDIDTAMVKRELDRIYQPVAIDWKVNLDHSGFTATNVDLDVTGSGLFSQYTEGMKALNNSFLEHKGSSFDESVIYLFLLWRSDDNITGDMPRSKQFGYIFTETALKGGGNEALVRTIAHEISHGAFHLNHTFDSQYRIPEKTTDNLLDYTSGTTLVKHQWDAIHDPGLVVGVFERDGEAMMRCLGWFDDCKNVIQMLEEIRNKRLKQEDFELTGQTNTDETTLDAYFIKIGETDYKKIRLIYKPEKETAKIDPLSYSAYNRQFLDEKGKIDEQHGFAYLKNNKELFRIIVDDDTAKISKLKVYLFGKGGSYETIARLFASKSELTPVEISDVREQIASLKDEEQKKELYLELQKKVPYHNQRNNNTKASDDDKDKVDIKNEKGEIIGKRDYTSQEVSDRMCNLTSEAMCLEYLGICSPNPNIQFENYLEQLRIDNDYGDRTTQEAREKIAEHLGACYDKKSYGSTFSIEKEKLKDFILPKLQTGSAVMLSIWPSCKGHLVRLQNITDEGLIIDDPYGKVTDFKTRQDCKSGGYDTNSKSDEKSKGSNNLWKWSDIEDITIKYVEIYSKCE